MTERERRKYPATIRLPLSYFRCRNPVCFAHWLDIALEKILPRRKCLLALRENYLYVYSANAPEVILAKFYSNEMHNASRKFRWLPQTHFHKHLNIVASENDNGVSRRGSLISCRLRNIHDAYECRRAFALFRAWELSAKSQEREEREISAIFDLYLR